MENNHISIIIIAIAFVLDNIFADPIKIPHIVNLLGKGISVGERFLYANKKLNGFILVIILVNISYWSTFYFLKLINFNIYLYIIISVFMAFQLLAGTTLIRVSKDIFTFLKNGELSKARQRVRWLVGRDNSQLTEQEIKQATLESMAENLSDGTIAPLFYYAIGGIPAMLCYKMINTLDSRIAYKNDKYINFGYAAAKLDDIANYIPARITALLMALDTLSIRSFKFIIKYGSAHTSPNSGYPEAALAGLIDCQFGGTHKYFGKDVEKPIIGENKRKFTYQDYKDTAKISIATAVFFLIIFNTILLIWY